MAYGYCPGLNLGTPVSFLESHPEVATHFRCVCSEHLLSYLDSGSKALAVDLGGTKESVPTCGAFSHLCGPHTVGLSGRVPPTPCPAPWGSTQPGGTL